MKKLLIVLLMILAFTACSSKTKNELYSEGVKQLEAANPSGAAVFFKNALEKDENYIDARFQLAKAYVKLGKKEQAEKEFLKVLRQNPSRDDVTLELAYLLNAVKKTDEAFKLGEQYLDKHPGSVEGLEILGISCVIKKKYDEAEEYLLQALKADPSRSKTKLELAALYISIGKTSTAKGLLEEIVQTDNKNIKALYMLAAIENGTGNSDKALEIYLKIIENKSTEILALYKSGLIYIQKENLDKADKIADDLIKHFPKRAEGQRLKGFVSYYHKDYKDAMTYLQTSLKIMPSLEGYRFLGLCFYNLGDLESALSQFRKILDNVPTSRQARLMTGAILLTQKRTDDAINEIRKVLQQNDKDAAAHNLLGNAYMAKGMFEEGMQELNRATRIDPKIVDAYVNKGRFYISQGKNKEGETELATAVRVAPDVLNSRLLLASHYLKGGKGSKALSLLRAGLTGKKSDAILYTSIAAALFSQNKLDEGIKNIQEAKKVDPALPTSYLNLANFYAATGKYDEAVDEYVSLLQKDARNYQAMLGLAILYGIKGNDSEAFLYYQQAKETKQPVAFLAHADYYLKRQENSKALKVLEEALVIDSHNLPVLEMKGRLLVNDKKYKDAVRVFEEIEKLNPEAGGTLKIFTYVAMKDTANAAIEARKIIGKNSSSAQGYMLLASVYEAQKDYKSAISEVKNGIRVDANNVQAILYLGKLYEAKKDYSKAMLAYSKALLKKPDFVPTLFAQGTLFDLTGKKKEAIKKYRAVLKESDRYVPAMNNLAYLCADGYCNKEEALRLAISAYKLKPGNALIMDTLGFALLKNSRLDDAKKVLEKAVNLLPNDPTVHYHLGLVYKEIGDKDNALLMLQKALSLGEFSDASKAKLFLSEFKR